MTAYVALLRAVNVGGTGKLPMTLLVEMCASAGFSEIRTYIASGNAVFISPEPADVVKAALEAELEKYAGKSVGVLVRTADEIAAVAAANPFPDAPGNRVIAIFLDAPPPGDAIAGARHVGKEEMRIGRREIYVRYDDGMADSRLVIPAAKTGTGRNMNTVSKLASMAAMLAATANN